MLSDCLAVTGVDGGPFAIAAIIAVVLIVIGIIAFRRTRGAAALILIPAAILTLVVGTGGAPALAYTAALPSATVSSTWTLDAGNYESETPIDPALTDLGTLFVDSEVAESVALVVGATTYVGAPFWVIDPTTYVITMAQAQLDPLVLLEDFGDVPVTLTITYDYADECDKPLQTVFTYTGTVPNPEPIG